MIHVLRSRRVPAAVALLLRAPVGAFFIYAALAKIEAPQTFARNIRAYVLLDPSLVPAVAYTLPWLELLCGALLILGLWVFEARLLTLAMLAAFVAAIASAMARGLDIECGCTGARSSRVGWPLLLLDVAMFLALIVDACLLRRARAGGGPPSAARRPPARPRDAAADDLAPRPADAHAAG